MAAIVKAAAMAREVREADGAEEWWLAVGAVGVDVVWTCVGGCRRGRDHGRVCGWVS